VAVPASTTYRFQCYHAAKAPFQDTHSMAADSTTIYLDDDSDLARALERANGTSVRLVKNGVVYRVSRDDDPWEGYDPERARAGMRRASGTLTREEAERLKEYLYQAREEGSRPADRP
jgi:hypothetical protein